MLSTIRFQIHALSLLICLPCPACAGLPGISGEFLLQRSQRYLSRRGSAANILIVFTLPQRGHWNTLHFPIRSATSANCLNLQHRVAVGLVERLLHSARRLEEKTWPVFRGVGLRILSACVLLLHCWQ